MQVAAIVVSLVATLIALPLVVKTALHIVEVVRLGQPDPLRFGAYRTRLRTTLIETFGHTRMLKWSLVGAAHWFVFIGFGALFFTLVEAYGELFSASFRFPWLLARWAPYEAFIEFIALATLLGILVLIAIRLSSSPADPTRKSRFAGSRMWQGYYVEWTIVVIACCVLALRGLHGAAARVDTYGLAHWVSYPLARLFADISPESLRTAILVVATVKIVVSMAWFVFIALDATAGVAWHRFTAFPNIFFRRNPEGTPALGPLRPMMSRGKPIDFEDPGEDDVFGVGKVEDLTWKGLLDLTTCTECGRCQSQCPAWHTGKPLSPKLVITTLRDHAYAKAPALLAGDTDAAELQRPLVGTAEEDGVIDPDVLWSCTTCGACVEQCPVDIEHVDHIVEMRRHQVLIESRFPPEAGTMLKNLENKGNPWGMSAAARTAWIDECDFPVRVLGADGEERIPDDVEYLYWVGCAGALEDRAKKTTKAFAELLHVAGVSFMVLGEAETCTGDPARRMGNEFLFQMQAQQNVEVLNEAFGDKPTRKVVASCPHCFNTLANEYPQLGGDFEVVHHTQLLGRLVAEGRLRPVTPVDGLVTYHDPCYLGRHNEVYTPPREVLATVPGMRTQEMPRCKQRGFCCGAGGARMWMEERIGKRINTERVEEALSLDPDVVSTACPFCLVMLSDSVTAKKQAGDAREEVEVVDVAQLLARSVRAAGPAPGVPAAPMPPAETGRGPVRATPQQTETADYPQLADDDGPGG